MREKLIELLDETFEKQYDKNLVITARSTANHLIANGVTIPVRCKDCKHSELEFFADNGTTRIESYKCFHHRMGINILDSDDFCSYGERRTDG